LEFQIKFRVSSFGFQVILHDGSSRHHEVHEGHD
jgi:hypothetical protein